MRSDRHNSIPAWVHGAVHELAMREARAANAHGDDRKAAYFVAMRRIAGRAAGKLGVYQARRWLGIARTRR